MQLETINVENNCITGVAKRIGQLPKLKYFLLANNQLKSLPFNPVQTAPGLRRLTLSGNQLAPDVMKLERDTEKPQMAAMAEVSEAAEGGDQG